MKTKLGTMCLIAAAGIALCAPGCGDEAGDDKPTGAGGSGSTSTGQGASSGAGAGSTSTGAGGSAPSTCPKDAKPLEELSGDVTGKVTLTADKDYLMKGIVQVKAGATLTIDPCTTIKGDKATLGTLVVEPGAKIYAEGEVDKPIVFTSLGEPGDRAAGDWGGVIVLGNAPINVPGGVANVEGITGDGTSYGGNDPTDDSGVIKYVRIEFSGIQLSPDNEINGLTLAGVGSGTTIDYVMVHNTLDDCFEFFGGTVNAKHLICAYNGDDGFDWDLGYRGKLQFLVVQQDPSVADDTNGFEGDNDADSSENLPFSEPIIYNATLVGKNVDVDKQQYGMLLRRSTRGHFFNIIATGFEAGVDVRDPLTDCELESSIFFGNLANNVAYTEDGSSDIEADDDGGFDERAWFADGGNSEEDPKLIAPFTPGAPDFRPETTLSEGAATPPDDGFFDSSAKYVGAFGADDEWAHGAWVSFSVN